MLDIILLEGNEVKLEPIQKKHKEALIEVVQDGKLWELFVTLVPKVEDIDKFIDDAILAQQNGDGLTFVTINKNNNKIVGSTRFMKANLSYKKIEIGYTFIAKTYQKTKINTEAKLLMLTYAFEKLHLVRVELLTDFLNQNSQKAITRLGAKKEGILRNHMIMPNGRVRDSVIFSIIDNEWIGVKENLEYKLLEQKR
ncbi:MAG TPA: N-acetyltransferase [Arcobacter sp.]|nr:N-acetyltransferase [Arcobacter sp.]